MPPAPAAVGSGSLVVVASGGLHADAGYMLRSFSQRLVARLGKLECYIHTSGLPRMSTLHPQVQMVTNDIIKSDQDKRLYRGLVLTNGLKVLLISDETTDKCSAALDVHVGHMSDPRPLPGLAHFCEHMLFLGTEKFPEENAYNKFLASHSGSSNAFTSPEHTNYYFDVAPEHFETALDMFSQFFLCPLFTESATEREVNAVNSENDKNLQSDAWRLSQIERAHCHPDHDFSKFGTGNKFTLDDNPKALGIDVRSELLAFHDKYYSANIMALAVLGKESLDALMETVINHFGSIKSKDVKVPEWLDHPCGPAQLKHRINVVPVANLRLMSMLWPIPDLEPYYESQPGHYLGHLIGHEGPGSLLSALKAQHWVNSLAAGAKHGAKGFQFFSVDVDLTEDGLEHVDDIIETVYQYIGMVRREGPQQWVFEECRDLGNLQFRFKDKERPSNYTCSLAKMLHSYPLKEVLSAPYVWKEFRPDLIEMVLGHLRPDNMVLTVVSDVYKGRTTEKEKWYGTDYIKERLADELVQRWTDPNSHGQVKLPSPNEFIPSDFSICPREIEAAVFPRIVKETPFLRCWHKQDNTFLLPKVYLTIQMTSPVAEMNPLCQFMTRLFVRLFDDALTEYSYDADVAGLKYNISVTACGMQLHVSGYNDKLHVLLERLMDLFTSFSVDPKRFDVLKEEYVRGLESFKARQPMNHATYFLALLTQEQFWTNQEALDVADDVTLAAIQSFIPTLLSRLHLEILAYGNVTADRAVELASLVEGPLLQQQHTKPLPAHHVRHSRRQIQLPGGCNFLYRGYNEVHSSSCLLSYYQCGFEDTHENMLLELLCQIIREPCFDVLRTKEQLGYIVHSAARRSCGSQGLLVLVQSDKPPTFVEQRVESFLAGVETLLREMDESAYAKHVQALITNRLEKPKKMSSQHSIYWTEIISEMYNFNRDIIETDHVKSISKEDLLAFFKTIVCPDAPSRSKLSVYVVSNDHRNAVDSNQQTDIVDGLVQESVLKTPELITDHNTFKRNMPLYPLPSRFCEAGTKSKL